MVPEPLEVLLMLSDPLPGLLPGFVSSIDPLPAAISGEVARPEGSTDAALVLLSLPEEVLEPVPTPSGPSSAPTMVEPPSLPDAKSTFGNEHEQIAVVPTTASRAEIAYLAMSDRRTQFSF